ncbi:MAG: ABC transporter ATP-binding protein [Paracoccaceae bacterium]
MIESLVTIKALGKTYPAADGQVTNVLSDINCVIEPGARIALIGPSGSGKSTLLHIIGGFIPATAGDVSWPALGAHQDLLPRKVQAVFQAPSLFPALTVCDNIALPLLLAGTSAAAGFTPDDLLARFGLSDLALKLPDELSGGQAQRIAMLRALSVSPRLILADEPTGQLDSKTAQEFLTMVIEVATQTHAALVIATHDPAVADRMDRQWSIDHGKLSEDSNKGNPP